MGRYAKGDEQVGYKSFIGNNNVKEVIEKYNRGAIDKLSDVHVKVQSAMGKKFGRSKFYKLWKEWRLDNDTRSRKKKRKDDSDGELNVEKVIEIAPTDRKRPKKWLTLD